MEDFAPRIDPRSSIFHLRCWPLSICILHFAFLFFTSGCSRSEPATSRVVVYCAHDREFAEDILGEFTRRTGLKGLPRHDTEANKPVGLYQDLGRRAARPRRDVHSNKEILPPTRLQ